ncbi:MAG: glycosyltransferase [Bacteroidia bacterium]|nr:glycosyltransferase [Bacteroidia bacterium]
MKLAIVSTHPPGKGTLNEYGYYLIRHFRQKPEIESVILITDKLPEGQQYHFPEEGAPVIVKEVWAFNDWSNLLKINKAVKETQPDVVLYNLQFLLFGSSKIPAALGLLSPFAVRIFGTPSVVLLHNILEEVDLSNAGITQNKLLQKIYNFIGSMLTRFLLKANMITVTIPKYVKVLEEKYKARNIALIPHGSFETPPLPDFEDKPGPFKVMTFGKFGTYKKVDGLIDAVEIIRKRTGMQIECIIAGTDSPNSTGYLAGIREKYASVPDMVYTGYVAEEDVPRLFTESSVVVLPYSGTTGSSGVLHQAGSYGKAVVLPKINDLAILIEEEGYEGAYFEPENTESLANAIQKVLEDKAYRRHLAEKNYFAAASLPMEDIADWFLIHFQDLIKK